MLRRFLCKLIYFARPRPAPQTCKDCWRTDGIDFEVPAGLWRAVVAGDRWSVPRAGTITNPALPRLL